MKAVSKKCRKHCAKRRKCWLPAFSPFPTMFSNTLFPWGLLKVGIVWEKVKACSNVLSNTEKIKVRLHRIYCLILIYTI